MKTTFKLNLQNPRNIVFKAVTCALFVTPAITPVHAQTSATASLVRFFYENSLAPENPVEANSAYLFSGNVGPYSIPGTEGTTTATVPKSSSGANPVHLAESGFGAPFAADVPYGDYESIVITNAQKLLYWEVADPADRDKAAFRYLRYLYGNDPTPTPVAGATVEERRIEVLEAEENDAEVTANLENLASAEVPSKEEFQASIPSDIVLTDDEKAALEHQRQVLERRVEFAQNQLLERQAAETREQSGVRNANTTVRCNFETISTYYGDAERARVLQALSILRDGLKFAPMSKPLANAYLDVFYDQAVAELQLIKIHKVNRAKYRLGLAAPETPFAIDSEIKVLRDQVLPKYDSIVTGLSQLLGERGGVDVSMLDSTYSPDTPLGFYMFKREQPSRNKNTATWLSGVTPLPVPSHDGTPSSATLFDGYKDYVMLLTIMSDYLTDSADMARMYGMRGLKTSTVDDLKAAMDLVTKVQQQSYMDVKLLEGMFSDYHPAPGDASGVYGARQGIVTAMGELEGVRAFLSGKANALGFDPNFLVLIKEFPDSVSGNQFDSYDALVRWVRNTPTSMYNFAHTTFLTARSEYETYRANADQLYNETVEIETALGQRLFEIIGTDDMEHPTISIENPAPGSELAQSLLQIQAITQKKSGLTSLTDEISDGVGEATDFVNTIIPGKRNSINQAFTTYRNTVTPEFDTITHWSSTAAGSQAAYDAVADVTAVATGGDIFGKVGNAVGSGVVAVAGVINTALQITAAEKQGNADKNINLAQADLDASLRQTDIDILEQQGAHELSALRREQIGNAIEFDSILSELAQERANYTGLVREVERMKQKAEENLNSLSDRFFADPIHQLRSQSSQLRADNAFQDAQKWVYFTQRALEYKWNKPFVMTVTGTNYDAGTIMKVRNFTELEGIMVALEAFNTTNLVGFTRSSNLDKLSLKYDFFGLRDDALYASTTSNGTSITINATTAFRNRLATFINPQNGLFKLPLDTFALNKQEGTFFTGPEYDSSGRVFSAGKYLDKIDWLKFYIVTESAPATPRIITGNYSYGGTSYIRTRVPSSMSVGDDREIRNEFRRFPFQYFLTLDNGATWLQRPTQDDTVDIAESRNSPSAADFQSASNRNTFLKERSVAATQQSLTLTVSKIDVAKVKDIEIYVGHNSVSRELPTGP